MLGGSLGHLWKISFHSSHIQYLQLFYLSAGSVLNKLNLSNDNKLSQTYNLSDKYHRYREYELAIISMGYFNFVLIKVIADILVKKTNTKNKSLL